MSFLFSLEESFIAGPVYDCERWSDWHSRQTGKAFRLMLIFVAAVVIAFHGNFRLVGHVFNFAFSGAIAVNHMELLLVVRELVMAHKVP